MSGVPDHAGTVEQPRREWLRGVLDLCVLAVLDDADRHGYGISQELERLGLGGVKGGTLYPLLARLEDDGAVAPEWDHPESGPARKVYTLTGAGRKHLQESAVHWLRFVGRAADLLEAATDQPTFTQRRALDRREMS